MNGRKYSHRAASLLILSILASGVGAIAVGAWLAIQMMLDPDTLFWLNQFLPQQTQLSVTQTMRTLPEIRGLIESMGMIPGDTLDLNTAQQDLLLPVHRKRPGCTTDCEYISQLRVYRRVETPKYFSTAGAYYQLVTQISVSYSSEELDTLFDDESTLSTSSVQLTSVELPSPQPQIKAPGVWLYLTGTRTQGDKTISYGQVLYYNPRAARMIEMLQWSSPVPNPLLWRSVTGDRTPELIINQTVGFEPKFKIYQIGPGQFRLAPVALVEISLTPFDLMNKNYQQALILASSGLWTPALKLLQPVTNSSEWSPGAQAQLDLIGLHSRASQSQANKSWASPSQQVLVYIIDGRWQKALQLFHNPHNQEEIARLLKTDSGSLWNRVKAAMGSGSTQPDVITWGALIRTAKDGRLSGRAWLAKQPRSSSNNHQLLEKLLDQLDHALWTSSMPHLSRIVASVEPKNELRQKDWLLPTGKLTLKLDRSQVWYQLRVAAFHNGQGWIRTPFSEQMVSSLSGAKLWHLLGLDLDPQINITFWTSRAREKTILATVKAVRVEKGVLRLLAAGKAIPDDDTLRSAPTPLAFSAKALEWFDPQIITLGDLSRDRPQLVRAILHQLWRELQGTGDFFSFHSLPPPTINQLQISFASVNVFPLLLGNLPVQLVDLTGDRQPEVVLTLSSQVLTSFNPRSRKTIAGPRTLIFDRTATAIIYSEFQGQESESLIAIADLGDSGTPGLLVDGSNSYRLLRWSSDRQRFE